MATHPYRSTLRAEQAALGRARVTRAALDEFAASGYSRTTIAAIAERAAVSVQTVYNAFGSKRALLGAAYTLAIRGESDEPLRESPAYRDMLEAPTAAEMVRRFAAVGAAASERTAPIVTVILGESGIDEVGKLVRIMERQRFAGAEHFIDRLTARFALRPGLGAEEAAESLWSIMSWEIAFRLTGQRRWSWDSYRGWLAETLVRTLLPIDDAAGAEGRAPITRRRAGRT